MLKAGARNQRKVKKYVTDLEIKETTEMTTKTPIKKPACYLYGNKFDNFNDSSYE